MTDTKRTLIRVKINKSAVDGRIVSEKYKDTHPKTTYTQTVTKIRIKKQAKKQ